MIRVHLRISGQIQGVFFRRSAKLEAEKLEIVGWIRNNADGSVEVMAQGPNETIDKFIAWSKKGPPFAKVEKVEVEWLSENQDFDHFDIL